jgi:hypothetical protein
MENEDTKEAVNKIHLNDKTVLTDDIKFMRSVIEKTYRVIEPGSTLFIVLGLIFLTGLPAMQFLLTSPQLKVFIQPMWIILWVIGAAVGIFGGFTSEIREKKSGYVSQLSNQIGFIWYILLLNGTIWAGLALFNISFGNPAFLWALILGFGLSVTGILSSKEWLFAGVAIFIAILAAAIIEHYAYVILGIVMGLGCIIPAIIAKRNYNKKEKNYESGK